MRRLWLLSPVKLNLTVVLQTTSKGWSNDLRSFQLAEAMGWCQWMGLCRDVG
jgi:hypothetical protein